MGVRGHFPSALANTLPGVKPCARRSQLPKTGRAKTRVVAKTRGRGEDTSRRQVCRRPMSCKDTWAPEDVSQRRVGEDTLARAQTLPEDRSSEDGSAAARFLPCSSEFQVEIRSLGPLRHRLLSEVSCEAEFQQENLSMSRTQIPRCISDLLC